jgi:hypothetical protein
MKYQLKDSEYIDNEERTIISFLWFPKCIENEWRWLCFSKIKQKYYSGDYYDSPMWMDLKWID